MVCIESLRRSANCRFCPWWYHRFGVFLLDCTVVQIICCCFFIWWEIQDGYQCLAKFKLDIYTEKLDLILKTNYNIRMLCGPKIQNDQQCIRRTKSCNQKCAENVFKIPLSETSKSFEKKMELFSIQDGHNNRT